MLELVFLSGVRSGVAIPVSHSLVLGRDAECSLEIPDPRGPFGVRGMAEMPFMPYAPAITAALHDATGVWFDAFPLTPPRVRAGLLAAGLG